MHSAGIDLVELKRIEKAIKNPRFRSRVFGREENAQLAARGFPVSGAAASFCAKEAFSKAIGTGIFAFNLWEAQLLRDELTGKPYLSLSGKARQLAGDLTFCVSVTHTAEYACAVVTAQKEAPDFSLPDGEGLRTLRACLKPRPFDSNKGDFGRLCCLCGSEGMAGAAAMSVGAALRCGAGLVEAVLPASIYPIVASRLAEPVFSLLHPQEDGTPGAADGETISAAVRRASAVLAGCGLGKSAAAFSALRRILRESRVPVILDADGINLAAEHKDILESFGGALVLTPHPGEMARLLGTGIAEVQADREAAARSFSREHRAIVVLKGAGTLVAAPDGRLYRNGTGNPGMAKGGSGDVLAGMIASFTAQGIDPYSAAVSAVYLHGFAGDRCAAEKSQSAMLPTDLIEMLPSLFLKIGR